MRPQTSELPSQVSRTDIGPQRSIIHPTSPKAETDGQWGSQSSSEPKELFEGISPEEVKAMMVLIKCHVGATTKKMEAFPVQPIRLQLRTLMIQADVAESSFDRLGAIECIVKAVECRRQALSLTPHGHAARPYHLAPFASSLLQKFELLGNLADINQAIHCWSQVVQLTPEWHPNRPDVLNNLGNSYQSRFHRFGEMTDVDRAIECQSQAVELTPDGHPARPGRLNGLGNSYQSRFEHLEELVDVDKAIECQIQAVLLTPDDYPIKPGMLNDLGNSYHARFARLGKLADVDEAIECQIRAAQLTSEGHPDKPGWLNDLGSSYLSRFERLGELSDVDKAIEFQTQAVKLTPDNHSNQQVGLNSLGKSYWSRFERLGKLEDVDMAIECQTQALQLTPDGHPATPSLLGDLGSSYESRFNRLGEIADVDKAIECQAQAVQLTPDGHPAKPSRLGNLGNSYRSRFNRLDELSDVAKAIECHTEAMLNIPDGHPNNFAGLNNLGGAYEARFKRLGEIADVDKAIEFQTKAVQLTPDGHPHKSTALNNLGNSYQSRFEHFGELADVEKAIECRNQAVQLTSEGHADKPGRLNNLGISYQSRFEYRGELADLEKAIECKSQAVQLTPDGDPDKPGWLSNLGKSYESRFERLGKLSDMTSAQSIFQQGAQLPLTSPESQLRCARNWAHTSSLLGLSPQRAYERCIELLPRLIWLGTTVSQRYSLLTKVDDLAMEAASWAISVQSYDLAIEWLEESRSIVWNQILHLRTPLDELFAVDPQLAQQLKLIASQLENAGSRQVGQDYMTGIKSDLEMAAQHHRHLAAEWEHCIDQARSIPGFHNFMQPQSAAELKAAATDGPVVIINTHSTCWDALIIFPQRSDVVHLPLGNLPLNEAVKSHGHPYFRGVAQHRGERGGGFGRVKKAPGTEDAFKSVLVALWSAVVKPILDVLGCERKMSVMELPRVTWCATGLLAMIPLHAAGLYDGSSPNAFDLIISSYTPSLHALLVSSAPTSQPEAGVLAVSQEFTKGLCSLPNTVQELEAIKKHAQATRFLQLNGENASVNAVLNAMELHSWVHLACHATQNPANPAHSAFHLSNGDLTLESITKCQFKNKGLAFLSACQTAKGDGELPDEAVHLAAGMLMAGYPSVIATMWSIWDDDGPVVAERVYAELLKDGIMDHKGAPRALHKAIAVLRERIGEDKFERWVPFIHIGV